jgi:hypothetical protein
MGPVQRQDPKVASPAQSDGVCSGIATDIFHSEGVAGYVCGKPCRGASATISSGILPKLLKVDVEGYEAAVLRGAKGMLSRLDRPAVAFEYYPDALRQCGARPEAFYQVLGGYALYYVDDFEGQKMPFGQPIHRLEEIEWGCNLFAVPLTEGSSARWGSALSSAQQRIRTFG